MAKKYSKPECTAIEINGTLEPILAASIFESYGERMTCDERCKAWHLCLDREKMKGKKCYDKEKMQYRF